MNVSGKNVVIVCDVFGTYSSINLSVSVITVNLQNVTTHWPSVSGDNYGEACLSFVFVSNHSVAFP